MGENAPEKRACFFSVRSLLTLWASQQKRPFIPNCRVDADFLKAIDWKWHSWGAGEGPWMETVDSHFHRSPAVSSIAAWHWMGGRGPPLHILFIIGFRRQRYDSHKSSAVYFWEASFQRQMNMFSLYTILFTRVLLFTNYHHWQSLPSGFISWTWNHWHKLNNSWAAFSCC